MNLQLNIPSVVHKIPVPVFTDMDLFFIGLMAIFFVSALIILFRKKIRRKVSFKFPVILSIIYYHFLLLDMGLSTPYGLTKCLAVEQNTYLAYLLFHLGWIAYPILIVLQAFLFFSIVLTFEFLLTKYIKNPFWRGIWKGIFIPFFILLCGIHLGATINNFKLC